MIEAVMISLEVTLARLGCNETGTDLPLKPEFKPPGILSMEK